MVQSRNTLPDCSNYYYCILDILYISFQNNCSLLIAELNKKAIMRKKKMES